MEVFYNEQYLSFYLRKACGTQYRYLSLRGYCPLLRSGEAQYNAVSITLSSAQEVPGSLIDVMIECDHGATGSMLQEMGYEEVHNIGGILDYNGKVEL